MSVGNSGSEKFSVVRTLGNSGSANNGDATIDGGESATTDSERGFDGTDNTTHGSGTIDPATLTGNSGDAGTGKRKRGRPAGSRNNASGNTGTGKASQSKATDSLTSILFSVHNMLASFVVPELAMDKEEARDLAVAIRQVTELYDMPLMDERTMAWVNLSMVAGKVYCPRVVAYSLNHKRKPKVVTPIKQPHGVDAAYADLSRNGVN